MSQSMTFKRRCGRAAFFLMILGLAAARWSEAAASDNAPRENAASENAAGAKAASDNAPAEAPPENAAQVVQLPARESFHLYLLIGQSNMAGRGAVDPDKNVSHPRVVKFDRSNGWAPATDPLHFDKTTAGVGPGSGFGPAMAEADESVTIGLIPCAVGGTPLKRWQKGGDLYEAAVRRTREAMRNGVLKGVIWHQGENDSQRAEDAATYGERLAQMIQDLRKDLGNERLPFVVGKLGTFLPPDRMPHVGTINEALESLPQKAPHTACVDSRGLKDKGDKIHFDSESAREFGRGYATAMRGLQQKLAAEK